MKILFNLNDFRIIFILLKIDFNIYKKQLLDQIIDYVIILAANVIILGNILQQVGLQANYSIFALTGILGVIGFWEIYPYAAELLYDFNHERRINYELLLPISNNLIFIKRITSFAIKCFILSISLLPIMKIFEWNTTSILNYSFIQLIFLIFFQLIMSGSFALFAISIIKESKYMNQLWSRIIFPIWIFGGFQFSWLTMNKVFPIFSYINLLNPMIYVMEGIRGILIKTEWFIPLYICCIAIIFFILLFGYIGIYRLKKFLDLI